MAKGIRLDPEDPKVKAILQKQINKSTGLSLYDTYKKDVLSQKSNLIPGLERGREGNEEGQDKAIKGPGRGKFNTKGHIDFSGIKWDSKWEHLVYMELEFLRQCKIIDSIELHPKFEIKHNDVLICNVDIDFAIKIKGKKFLVDAKSKFTSKTRGWTLVKKMIKAFHGFDVVVLYQEDNNVKDVIYKLKEMC